MSEKERIVRAALKQAEDCGQAHLARLYRNMLRTLASRVPAIPFREKPKVVFVVDHKGWCGERLSLDIIKHLGEGLECEIVRLGDKEHLSFDADLYVYRNVSWLHAVQLPDEMYRRVITLVESERVFSQQYTHFFSRLAGVIPLNEELAARVRQYSPKHVWAPLPNGINTDEFTPAAQPPAVFTVGSAGNFSLDYYDDWKGFSRYIVPACAKAGVKLDWRSWRGCSCTPGLKSKQAPLDEMPDFYRGLSCFVLMSRAEGCSGVTFEAMASGLPVISTQVGWHGEQDGTGIIWANRPTEETPENVAQAVDDLAKAILRVKANWKPNTQGRAFAERYSWQHVAPQWKAALDFYIRASRTGRYE